MLDPFELTGRVRTHLIDIEVPRCTLHRDAVEPFLALRGAALADGIDLVPVSSFRDFDRQLAIWNAKYRGERPLLDRDSRPLDAATLTPAARVEAILGWSALPGASRHHWGSDLDVIDRAALRPGVEPQLLPAEFGAGGPFERLDAWLEAHLSRFGFFRPYRTDRGGVSPEPWHVSFAPVAVPAAAQLTLELLRDTLQSASQIDGVEALFAALPALHARYVQQTDAPNSLA